MDAAFTFARTMGCVLAGWMIDRLGARRGFSIGLTGWSIAGVLHGLVNGVRGMPFTRFRLGRGEAGHLPASIKSVAEWFPRKERSFAPGLFNAVGAVPKLEPVKGADERAPEDVVAFDWDGGIAGPALVAGPRPADQRPPGKVRDTAEVGVRRRATRVSARSRAGAGGPGYLKPSACGSASERAGQ